MTTKKMEGGTVPVPGCARSLC